MLKHYLTFISQNIGDSVIESSNKNLLELETTSMFITNNGGQPVYDIMCMATLQCPLCAVCLIHTCYKPEVVMSY